MPEVVSTRTASEKLMVRLITSPMVYVPSAVVAATPVTDAGKVFSMIRSALALRDPASPGAARVRMAGLPAASLMVPPLRASAVVES